MTSDDRMTWGPIIDVIDVLERHGYRKSGNQQTGQAVGVIFDLARVYEGTHEASYGTYPGHVQPGPPCPEPDQDAVVLSHADVGTVFGALDIAADYKRDRAGACADCPDQSCPTCQARLQDARTYDQMAGRCSRPPKPPGPPPPARPSPRPTRRQASDHTPQDTGRTRNRPPGRFAPYPRPTSGREGHSRNGRTL